MKPLSKNQVKDPGNALQNQNLDCYVYSFSHLEINPTVKITSKTLKLGELNSQICINNEDLPEHTKLTLPGFLWSMLRLPLCSS